MSRFARRCGDEAEEHDISKELFLGIMMLMLSLGVLILNATQPAWRVHRLEPAPGDVVLVYTAAAMGLSRDGQTLLQRLDEAEFRRLVEDLIAAPDTDLHLFLRGGSRETLVRHALYADSLLSTDAQGQKVRPAVFVHAW